MWEFRLERMRSLEMGENEIIQLKRRITQRIDEKRSEKKLRLIFRLNIEFGISPP
jgi:hypothetical protein